MFKKLENWLPKTLVNEIDKVMSSDQIPWIYKATTVNPENVEELKYKFPHINETHQFVHLLYDNGQAVSPLWEIVRPLIHFFEYHTNQTVTDIGRIKANMLFQDSTVTTTHNTPHVDVYDDDWTSIVYYANQADGDTVMFDKDLREMDRSGFAQGHAVYFPSNIMHSSSNPKNAYRRIVVNIVVKTKENK
jgi:hypothetical protein